MKKKQEFFAARHIKQIQVSKAEMVETIDIG